MIRLIEILACGVTDDAGAALANGTVTSYLAGTTTLETLYEDFELETPLANPITLSASGRQIAFANERVKLVFHNAAGNLVRTINNVGTSDSDVPTSTEQAIPSGAIMGYGGSTAPTGWLSCNGSAVSRTTYANLFAAIGESYGSGDATTTFNLPDGLGRALVGDGAGSGLTTRARGDEFGAEALPAHTHTATTAGGGSHNHSYGFSTAEGSGSLAQQGTSISSGNGTTSSESSHTHVITVGSTGTGSHGVMQPSFVAKYIIKT